MEKQQINQKKRLAFIFIAVLFLFFWRREPIISIIEHQLPIEKTERSFPYAQVTQTALKMEAEENLSWKIIPNGRAIRIGIRFGTYQRINHSIYEMTLSTENGLMLAKKRLDASQLKDNEYEWIDSSKALRAGESYWLKIVPVQVSQGNEIAIFTIDTRENSFEIGKGQPVIAYDYAVSEKGYLSFIVVLCMVVFLVCSFGIQRISHFLVLIKQVGRWLEKEKRNCYLILFLVGWLGVAIALLIGKQRVHLISDVYESDTSSIVEMKQGEEYFLNPETSEWNTVSIRLVTYMERYPSGKFIVNLYDKQGLITKKIFEAKEIQDDTYFKIQFSKKEVEKKEKVRIGFQIELPEGSRCGFYYTSDQEIVHRLEQIEKSPDWFLAICFLCLVVAGILYGIQLRPSFKKVGSCLLFLEVGAICGVLLYTYHTYQTITLDAIHKTVSVSKQEKELMVFDRTWCQNNRTEYESYYLSGGKKMQYICYTIPHINTEIESITLQFQSESVPKVHQGINIYYDLGDGFQSKQRVGYEMIYRGEDSITIPFWYLKEVRGIRIDFGTSLNHLSNVDTPYYDVVELSLNKKNSHSKSLLLWIVCSVFVFLFLWIYQEYDWDKKVLAFGKRIGWKPEVIFLILCLSFGGVISILIPLAQVPDEGAHMNMSLGITLKGETVSQSINGVMEHAGISVDKQAYKQMLNLVMKEKPQVTLGGFLKYPGVYVGAILAYLFHLPMFWFFTLAEMVALLFYSVIGYFTIKRIPFHKNTMMAVMLLPMALQQAGSWSYDSFNNAIAFYLVAYIFYLKYRKEKIKLSQLISLFLLSFLLLYIKKIYVILALLLFIIPLEHFDIRIGHVTLDLKRLIQNKKFWVLIGISSCFIAIAGYFVFSKMDSVKMMLELIQYPEQLLLLIGKTLVNHRIFYIKSLLGSFGWLDLNMIPAYYWGTGFLLIYIMFHISSKEQVNIQRNFKKERIIMGSIFLLGTGLICCSMLSWTLFVEGIDTISVEELYYLKSISGVQGRYFLPFLPLLLFMPKEKEEKSKYSFVIQSIYFIVIPVFVICQLYVRYWS